MTTKLLLALQFWNGDKEQAMKLSRLIADIQPGFCNQADFLFAARFDTEQDEATINQVARKFRVHHFVNKNRRGEGWPAGCNDLFFGTMDWAYTYGVAEMIPTYKAILTFEADSCPLHPNWVKSLSEGWDAANTKQYGPLIAAAPGLREHINGNCLFSGDMDYLKWIARDVGGCTPHVGWDYVKADAFKERGCKNATMMRSLYRKTTMTEGEYQRNLQEGVSFLHGVKDDSLIRIVRNRYAL